MLLHEVSLSQRHITTYMELTRSMPFPFPVVLVADRSYLGLWSMFGLASSSGALTESAVTFATS